jgi:hypothetical protein
MSSTTAEAIKLTVTLGDFTYSYDLAFLGSLALAVAVVFFFSVSKFGESTMEQRPDDYVSQLLPKYLATPEEYSRALIVYVTTMSLAVVVLSLLGPRVISFGATSTPDAPSALPLFIALVLVGMLPNVPWLQQLELHLRRFAHERAFIPKAARATSERLASAEFNFEAFQPNCVLKSPGMRGVELSDFTAPRDSIEYSWARLSCLLSQLRRLQDTGVPESLDGEMLERYSADLDSLWVKRRSMEDDVLQYRKAKLNDPYYGDEQLHQSVHKTLKQLYVLIGCAVRLSLDADAEINPALKQFGFVLNTTGHRDENQNVMVVGLATMVIIVFVMTFAAIGIHYFFASEDGRWVASSDFPRSPLDALLFAVSTLIGHGAAIVVAEKIRARRIGKGRWFARTGSVRRRIAANYVWVALACGGASIAVLSLWALIFQGVSLEVIGMVAPFALLPTATGVFYARYLDNVELDKRPARLLEILTQAVVTGLCGFFVACVWVARRPDASETVYDYVIFFTLLGSAIGASLAWYIPEAAASAKYDPLADALEARVQVLKAEATRSFGNTEAAERWMNQPNAGLDNQSPRAASTDIASFEKAVALLNNRAPALVEITKAA